MGSVISDLWSKARNFLTIYFSEIDKFEYNSYLPFTLKIPRGEDYYWRGIEDQCNLLRPNQKAN